MGQGPSVKPGTAPQTPVSGKPGIAPTPAVGKPGAPPAAKPGGPAPAQVSPAAAKLKQVLDSMDQRVGMKSVKAQVQKLVAGATMDAARKAQGTPVDPRTMHLLFTGRPGTGKTVTAKDIGQLYHALGLLSTDHVEEVTPDMVIGAYSGWTEKQTAEKIKAALGGVLFFDEAYTLTESKSGKQALNMIMDAMEKHRDDLVVIFAGYDDLPQKLRDVNPGMASRISNVIHFPNFTKPEKKKLLEQWIDKAGYKMTPAAKAATTKAMSYMPEGEHSANARDVRNLWDQIRASPDIRLHQAGITEGPALQLITPSDIAAGTTAFRESVSRFNRPQNKPNEDYD